MGPHHYYDTPEALLFPWCLMFLRQRPAKSAAQRASIVLAAASLAITGCDNRQTAFSSANVARETVPKSASDTKLAFLKLSDHTMMAFGSTKGVLRVFKTASGYAERGSGFDAFVVSGSHDSSGSNEYAEVSYLEALALIDGDWRKAESAARLQGLGQTNFVSASLIRMTLEPLVVPMKPDQSGMRGEFFTDGPVMIAYPMYEIMRRVTEIELGSGELSLAVRHEGQERKLKAKVDSATTDGEQAAAQSEFAAARIGNGLRRGAYKAAADFFNFANEQNANHWIERFRTSREADYLSRPYSNVTSNMLEIGTILLPRHAPVFVKLPDGENLVRVAQFGEEIRFFRTASGYGVTGVKGAVHIPGAGSAGVGVERPTALLYTEISSQELREYYKGELQPIFTAVDRQAEVTSFTVSPILVREKLLPRLEVLKEEIARLQAEKATLVQRLEASRSSK